MLGLPPALSADTPDGRSYRASLYLWGAGIAGETPRGSEIDVGFDTLIKNLDLAFMGAFEARQGPWALIGNAIWIYAEALPAGWLTQEDATLQMRAIALAQGAESAPTSLIAALAEEEASKFVEPLG